MAALKNKLGITDSTELARELTIVMNMKAIIAIELKILSRIHGIKAKKRLVKMS